MQARSARVNLGWISRVAVALCLVTAQGCSSSKPPVKLYRVAGVLQFNSQRVPSCILHFIPEKGGASTAISGSEGQFTLLGPGGRPGAVAGRHIVWLEYRPQSPAEEMQMREGKSSLSPELLAALKKYGSLESSPLKVIIDNDNDNLLINLE